jgi:hypothetical protein
MVRKATVATAMWGWKAVTTAPGRDHPEGPQGHRHSGDAVGQPAADQGAMDGAGLLPVAGAAPQDAASASPASASSRSTWGV